MLEGLCTFSSLCLVVLVHLLAVLKFFYLMLGLLVQHLHRINMVLRHSYCLTCVAMVILQLDVHIPNVVSRLLSSVFHALLNLGLLSPL